MKELTAVKQKEWTVRDVLDWSENFLSEKRLADPKQDAELLLMDILNYSRTELFLNYRLVLTDEQRQKYRKAIIRRSKNEPIQYISGQAYFFGKKYLVNESVLIPRQDTETLVLTVWEKLKRLENSELTIIDVGTGSGIIAIELAKLFKKSLVLAGDISTRALVLAGENARLHGVSGRIDFIESDLLSNLIHCAQDNPVVLVANPPYVTLAEYETLDAEVKQYEPKQALLADDREGLKYYKKLTAQAAVFGDNLAGVFFEVGYRQARAVKDILFRRWHNPVESTLDLGGIDRVVYTVF